MQAGSPTNNGGIVHFIRASRVPLNGNDGIRLVYRSELIRRAANLILDEYLAEKVPQFYRRLDSIVADLQAGFFLTAVRETIAKLPTSESFQQSQFGEIVAGVFAEEVLGLRRLYSKLTMLTAQNANAFKMDLVMYDPRETPLAFVFGEVKCSPKSAADGLPANHDKSCFSELFNSLRMYADRDKQFDLTAARDNLAHLPDTDRERVKAALLPYSGSPVRYAGFTVIDTGTFCDAEASVLRTRASAKLFNVDLICVETFKDVATSAYGILKGFA